MVDAGAREPFLRGFPRTTDESLLIDHPTQKKGAQCTLRQLQAPVTATKGAAETMEAVVQPVKADAELTGERNSANSLSRTNCSS